jgi:bacitracin transport system permease protein
MMLIEAIQTHFEHPEQSFSLNDIYKDSLLYIMLLMNIMICVAISAYLFSREYTEKTLKTILPIPVSRNKLILGKFCTLFLWIMMLEVVTWAGILFFSFGYHLIIGMGSFYVTDAMRWLVKFLIGGVMMFITISPYTYLAEKTKGLVSPMIVSAVMIMGSAALCNQKFGALYPWTATYFLIGGKIESSGYPPILSIVIISVLSIAGFITTFIYFNKEDLK